MPEAPTPEAEPGATPRIATAGWAIPRAVVCEFPADGAGLTRYAARFQAAEINSTFYRSHRASTYARWAASTPDGFRFALKLPRAVTHEARLVESGRLLEAFQRETEPLGRKRGPLLVQLPPSLPFDRDVAARFFAALRALWPQAVVCEPRHATWFSEPADRLLRSHRVARVAADPARHPGAGQPGGWPGMVYWRLHGSPRMYYSAYADATLHRMAADIRSPRVETWCVFDNTASGAAAADALRLSAMLR